MSQYRRYARGAEDMQEFIARALEHVADKDKPSAELLTGLAFHIRALTPEAIRRAMERDDVWMRKVAEREIEHIRAGYRARTAAYQDRQRRKAAGENVPPAPRGAKRKFIP